MQLCKKLCFSAPLCTVLLYATYASTFLYAQQTPVSAPVITAPSAPEAPTAPFIEPPELTVNPAQANRTQPSRFQKKIQNKRVVKCGAKRCGSTNVRCFNRFRFKFTFFFVAPRHTAFRNGTKRQQSFNKRCPKRTKQSKRTNANGSSFKYRNRKTRCNFSRCKKNKRGKCSNGNVRSKPNKHKNRTYQTKYPRTAI